MSDWIKCSERLPAIGQQVVVYRPMAPESDDSPLAVDTYTGRPRTSPQGVLHGFSRWCHPTLWAPIPDLPEDPTHD